MKIYENSDFIVSSEIKEEAESYGVDLSLIEASLQKTPAERLEAHNSALQLAEVLRIAKQNRFRLGT